MLNSFFIFNKNELIFLLALFLLGIILGATLLNLYISQEMDQVILKNKELESKVEEQNEQINKLEENLKAYRGRIINKLTIILESDLNEHTKQNIKNKIRELVRGVVGREIRTLDPLLLRDIVHNRYLPIDKRTYHLELIYLVISEELTMYFKVTTNIPQKEAE